MNKFLKINVSRNGTFTLYDELLGTRNRAAGYGYDKLGTVFGSWLSKNYKEEIEALENKSNFYGIYSRKDGSFYLEGACGFECMEKIAEAIGLKVYTIHFNRKILGIMLEIPVALYKIKFVEKSCIQQLLERHNANIS